MTSNLVDKKKALEIFAVLENVYPEAKTELKYQSDFELLVAVILSAQCTDRRVNIVTDKLFKVANTPLQFAEMSNEELEKWIFSCGFYKNKAKNIINASKEILCKFGGNVPSTMEHLMSLSGVGRKTANVMLAVAFGSDNAFAVDTHVFRVSRRLGLASGNTPELIEKQITTLLYGEALGKFHHLLIFHGRYCCHSQKPNCVECKVTHMCNYYQSK